MNPETEYLCPRIACQQPWNYASLGLWEDGKKHFRCRKRNEKAALSEIKCQAESRALTPNRANRFDHHDQHWVSCKQVPHLMRLAHLRSCPSSGSSGSSCASAKITNLSQQLFLRAHCFLSWALYDPPPEGSTAAAAQAKSTRHEGNVALPCLLFSWRRLWGELRVAYVAIRLPDVGTCAKGMLLERVPRLCRRGSFLKRRYDCCITFP